VGPPTRSPASFRLLSRSACGASASIITIPFEGTIVNTTLHRSDIHPPDIEDREVLQIPRPDELRRLSLADRLSLRIGLWLFQRAQRPRHQRRSLHIDPAGLFLLGEQRHRSAAESNALLTFDMQRGMR
jgi:hypothetical protein